MLRYILKRLLMLIPVLLGVTFIVFSLLYITPGDPAMIVLGPNATPAAYEQMKKDMGLDAPFLVQYVRFLFGYEHEVFGYKGLLFGDLGRSYVTNRNVFEMILGSFPNTLLLATGALIFAALLGIPVGILSAVRQYSTLDMVSTVLALAGVAMPVFWLAMVLIYVFAETLGFLPSLADPRNPVSMILPITTLGLYSTALILRMTRSAMLEIMRTDYVRTARAKGMEEGVVVRKHALRNALIPIVTVVGLEFGALLGGAVLTEQIFAYPGIGTIMFKAIGEKDTPQILGSVCFVALVFTVVNLVVDILYGFIDPRVKASIQNSKSVNFKVVWNDFISRVRGKQNP